MVGTTAQTVVTSGVIGLETKGVPATEVIEYLKEWGEYIPDTIDWIQYEYETHR